MDVDHRIRIVIGKVDFDPHDRGILALVKAFRDAGMEAIFQGKLKTAEEVVRTAIDESADVIALNDHCGVMRVIATDAMEPLEKYEATDICVVAGGVIEVEDKPLLEAMGVTGNHTAGTSFEVIVNHIRGRVRRERWQEA
ncbi:MAG: cobalamin-dependent protein [Alphaproteobacteria bacterium]|jgi:methylmalonyl-CoA mutase C-terminal domain/subunit|nr:cobalamin-dependent protein [Alphaproteobacteria bacterium]